MERVNGTCIEIEGHGVLLRGPSGAGKSDMALRLISEGAYLIADDYTEIHRSHAQLVARAPANLAGLIEVRGLGILRMTARPHSALIACVDLVAPDQVARTPPMEMTTIGTDGWRLPLFRLTPFEASATAKIRFAVRLCAGGIVKVA